MEDSVGPTASLDCFWGKENHLSLPEFESQTVQPVASHSANYTNLTCACNLDERQKNGHRNTCLHIDTFNSRCIWDIGVQETPHTGQAAL